MPHAGHLVLQVAFLTLLEKYVLFNFALIFTQGMLNWYAGSLAAPRPPSASDERRLYLSRRELPIPTSIGAPM